MFVGSMRITVVHLNSFEQQNSYKNRNFCIRFAPKRDIWGKRYYYICYWTLPFQIWIVFKDVHLSREQLHIFVNNTLIFVKKSLYTNSVIFFILFSFIYRCFVTKK